MTIRLWTASIFTAAVVSLACEARAEVPDLWSFKPVIRPEVKSENAIEELVSRSHAEHGLEPVAPAPPEVLLRRVYFDLIGLPLTPEELDEFLQDGPSDAYEKVVDRLLADPQYGVRYARYWLDLMRYIDVDGGMAAEPGIYRWRDWVISALNDDLPASPIYDNRSAGTLHAKQSSYRTGGRPDGFQAS